MIVGVDISSRRVDLAWLEDGRPCRWHQELEGKHLIDRLRAIQIHWPMWFDKDAQLWDEAQEIAIEYPFGRSRATVAALCAVAGIVTRQAPTWARVAWPSAGELRAAIHAKNQKHAAHQALHDAGHCPHTTDYCILLDWNEHELDALVTCIGWTRILAANEDT